MYKQRDIVMLPFPHTDLTRGKLRPALIISNSKIENEDKICCLITSNPKGKNMAIIAKNIENGRLPLKSYVKSYRIFTAQNRIIKKKLCRVTKSFHRAVLNDFFAYVEA